MLKLFEGYPVLGHPVGHPTGRLSPLPCGLIFPTLLPFPSHKSRRGCAMREGFVLYAYDPNREVSVPIARVIMLSEDYIFFERLWRKRLNANGFLMWVVLEYIKKYHPDLLAPYGDGWEFYLNAEALAVMKGHDLDELPIVDMT